MAALAVWLGPAPALAQAGAGPQDLPAQGWLLLLSLGLVAAAAAILIWNLLLRRRAALVAQSLQQKQLLLEQSELAARFSQERYRLLVDNLVDLVVEIDPQGCLLFASPPFQEIVGIAPEDFVGRPIWDLIDAEDHKAFLEAMAGLALAPHIGYVEGRCLTAQGRRWFGWTGKGLLDGKGRLTSIVAVGRDLEDRKAVEEELLRSTRLAQELAEEQRLLLTHTRDMVYRHDAQGLFTYVSPAVQQITGYRPDQWLANYATYLTDNPINLQARAITEESLRTGQEFPPYLVEVRRADGRPITLEVRERPYLEAGRVAGVVGMARDVTASILTEQALKNSERRLAELFNFLPDPTFAVDAEGRVIAWNQAMEEMTGVGAADILGKGDYEYALAFHGRRRPVLVDVALKCDLEEAQRRYPKLRAENRVLVTEVFLPRIGPQGTYLLARASRLYDSQGRVVGAIEAVRDITDRKLAEMALMANEARYRTTVECTGTALVIIEEDTVISMANSRFCRLSGHAREEIEGKLSWTSFVYPPDLERMVLFHRRRREEGLDIPTEYEFRFLDRQKRMRHMLVNVTVIPGTKQSVASLIDITDRKLAEEALRLSESRYRTMFEHTGTAMMVLNQDTSVALVNEVFVRMSGYDKKEIEGRMSWRQFVAPEDLPRMLEFHQRRRSPGQSPPPQEYEFIFVDRQGRRRHVINNVVMIPGTDQSLASLLDITGRRRAEEERLRLATAIEQAAEMVVITDAQGVLQYVNPAFEQTTGFGRQEAVGQGWRGRLALHPEAESTLAQGVAAGLGGQGWRGQLRNRRKDGTLYEVEANISPVRDAQGRVVNLVGVGRDVTKEKMLERQLRQAQKMEAIGALAGGIAHDFNNLLMGIIGYTELAQRAGGGRGPLQESLEQVLQASHRAKDLVRQILAFSRPGDRRLRPVAVGQVAQEALSLLRASLPAGVECELTVNSVADTVLAESTQIHQVLLNLGANAAYAMREQGGRLKVEVGDVYIGLAEAGRYEGLAPGPHLRLSVSDTGHGMEPQVMERIFDPLFTTKPPEEGSGMGLAVVRGIVEGLGGTVTVYSEPGQGTTFNIYLPRAAEPAPAEPAEAEAATLPEGRERILLVDDEEALAFMGQQLLEDLGYQVTARTSSLEALGLFRDRPQDFDLVVTDHGMPQLTGTDMAREMLALRPDVPIILCTGLGGIIGPEQAKALGIREFVMKPFAVRDLACTIRRVLDQGAPPPGC